MQKRKGVASRSIEATAYNHLSSSESSILVRDGLLNKCFFPACTCQHAECRSRIELRIGIRCDASAKNGKDKHEVVVLRGIACKEHSNLVKARKQKKKLRLQQHSHMRNALVTVLAAVNKSLKRSSTDLCPLS